MPRRFLFLALLALALLGCVLPTHSAHAYQHPQRSTGDKAHDVTYHHGPIIAGTMNLYYIFLAQPGQENSPEFQKYRDTIIQFTNDLGAANFYGDVLKQYPDELGHVATGIALKQSVTQVEDTPLEDNADIETIKQFQQDNGLPRYSANNMYVVFATEADSDFMGDGCGWHSAWGTKRGGSRAYSFYSVVGYPRHGCGSKEQPNGPVDGSINTLFHELMEASVDPVPDRGWYDGLSQVEGQGEISDKCDDTGQSVMWNGHAYYTQKIWSNAVHDCVLS